MTTALPAGAPRHGLIAAGVVVVAYLIFFAVRLGMGHAVDPVHAVAQIGFQMMGFGLLVLAASWLKRRLH